jgi:hypothetical protein
LILMTPIATFRRSAGVLGTDVPLAAALVGLDVAARLLPLGGDDDSACRS